MTDLELSIFEMRCSHLESALYLLSEVMDVTLLHRRSLCFSLLGEVDAGVSLVLTDSRGLGGGRGQAGAEPAVTNIRYSSISVISLPLQLYLVTLTITANECNFVTTKRSGPLRI